MSESESGSEQELDPPSFRQSLQDCLDEITATGQIASFKNYSEFPIPGLNIDGIGEISLPLTEQDAQAIKSLGRQAPFGHNDQTVVDTSVRNTWELDETQYRLNNPHWETFFCSKVLRDSADELGIESMVAKSHKLLLYEPGSFFKRHKDTEKETGMIGTLVVCLPSKHEGSDVKLFLRNESRVLQTAPTSNYNLTALAWYSDVDHEVEKLISGYRLVLTWKLFIKGKGNFSARTVVHQKDQLRSVFAQLRASRHEFAQLAYGLDHQYTKSSICLRNLKGRDRSICRSLQALCSKAGFYVLLAHVERRESEPQYRGDYYEEDQEEPETDLRTVYSLDGELIATDVEVYNDDVLGINYDRAPDSHDEGGEYTGNEDAPDIYRYNDAAVVLVSKGKLRHFLKRDPEVYWAEVDTRAVAMVNLVAHDLEQNMKTARLFCIAALVMPVLDRSMTPSGVRKVDQWITEILQKRFDEEGNGVDWNKWLGFLTNGTSARKCASILLRLTSKDLSQDAQVSLRKWSVEVMDPKWEAQEKWDREDQKLLEKKMESCNDNEWLLQKFLPSIASKGSDRPIFEILKHIAEGRDSTYAGKAAEMYNAMLKSSGSKLVLKTEEVIKAIKGNGSFTETFLTMIGGGYASEAREEASKLLDMTCSQLASSLPGTAAKEWVSPGGFVDRLLRPLTARLSTHHVPPIPSVQELFEKGLRILPELYVEEKEESDGLTGWALRPRGCKNDKGEICKDCVAMDEFLTSETRQVWEFIGAGDKERQHIKDQLCWCGHGHVTVEKYPAHKLVVKKTMTEEDRVKEQHAATMKTVNSALEPLRVEYVKELLGEEKYQELVMLEPTKTSKGEAQSSPQTATTNPLKNEAEGSPEVARTDPSKGDAEGCLETETSDQSKREAEGSPKTTTTNSLKREAESSPEAASKRQRQ